MLIISLDIIIMSKYRTIIENFENDCTSPCLIEN